MSIWNTDPKIDYMPAFFMNYMMTSVLYANMTNLISFSEGLNDLESDPEKYGVYSDRVDEAHRRASPPGRLHGTEQPA